MEETEIVPGTIHLVDLEDRIHARHAGRGQRDVVLVPQPSNDPDDPLNWHRWRKHVFSTCICVYTLMVGIASAAIYSVLVPISQATGLTLDDLNDGTGYMFLMFGWGCLFWQPIAVQYGKRPVYLFSTLATMAIMVWVPYTKTNGQWIGSKLLQGFFGAPIESLCEISVTDVYFTHERGSYIAIYALFLAGSNFLAPVLAGFIDDGQGWEWVLYWCAIFCAIAFVFLFFFMEETNFQRPANNIEVTDNVAFEGKTPNEFSTIEASSGTPPGGFISKGQKSKSYLQKLRVFEKEQLKKPNELKGMILRPLIFLTFPVVVFSGVTLGSHLIYFNILNGTASLILSSPPYSFKSSFVGLSYVSPLIGITLGSWYTGQLGDWLNLRMARRNKGIMESEYRLWLFCASLVLVPGGLLLWGVGAAHRIHWFGLIFAMGTLGFTSGLGIQLSLSYCIDSYRELSSDAVVTVIIIRSMMSFAVSYGITPWVTNMGLQNAFIVAAFAGLVQVSTFAVFLIWGRRLREASVPRYKYYVNQRREAGYTDSS
ncbi:MFS general substrate transporter [Viridothelium virens]|uniref:MFS general substrate transporter n=1 Tax=Viridothelium virens TaxID=1048519 RepID=A0A6A6H9Y6_VIRVR|nr:MFS general substrate transporter [Viridothelium virens]